VNGTGRAERSSLNRLRKQNKAAAFAGRGSGGENPCRRPSGSASVPAFVLWGIRMHITLAHVGPLVALLAGILILIMPRLLNYIVAIYLIFVGITGLWPRLLH